jgi:hypothetical protein
MVCRSYKMAAKSPENVVEGGHGVQKLQDGCQACRKRCGWRLWCAAVTRWLPSLLKTLWREIWCAEVTRWLPSLLKTLWMEVVVYRSYKMAAKPAENVVDGGYGVQKVQDGCQACRKRCGWRLWCAEVTRWLPSLLKTLWREVIVCRSYKMAAKPAENVVDGGCGVQKLQDGCHTC